MTDLGTFGGQYSFGFALNSVGEVTGFASALYEDMHAFVYRNDQLLDLGTFGGSFSAGYAINDFGQVTGEATTSVGHSHAFLATSISLLYQRLLTRVQGVGPGSSLATKIRDALAYYDADDGPATCATLEGFVNHLAAQSGKKINTATSARLSADAKEIQSVIGCN